MEFVVTDGSSTFHADNPSLFYSDIIMPQADQFFEQHQGFIRKISEIQLALKCADPPGEARSSLWISMQLEKRLGVLDKSQPKLKDYVDDPKKLDDAQVDLFKAGWEKFIARDDIKALNPPSWDQFLKTQFWHVPYIGESHRAQNNPPYDWFRNNGFIADPVKKPIDTPSGKMQVYSDRLTDPKMPTMGIVTPKGFVAEICYGGASPTLIPPMPQFVGHIQPDGPLNKFAEQYPLCVVSLHSNYRAHHSNDSNPDFRIEARHACWLSVADAKARGIKDGDMVRVYSPQGEAIMPAYVTPRVAPGTSNVGYGAWSVPSAVKTALDPDGVDMRGMHNMLTPSAQYPWITGVNSVETNCQVEKL
jgi:anaerobic selenocysteine-containing dehydrogenase